MFWNGQHKTKKTVNFRVCNVTFFEKDKNERLRLIASDTTPEERLLADGATSERLITPNLDVITPKQLLPNR